MALPTYWRSMTLVKDPILVACLAGLTPQLYDLGELLGPASQALGPAL